MLRLVILSLFLITLPAFAQFTNESELGVVVSSGNSNTETYNYVQTNTYSWDANKFKLKGHYLKGLANGTRNALNYDAGLRYERELNERFSIFTGYVYEVDRFAGYDPRHIADLGGKYGIIKEETLKWNAELGYRYMNENRFTLNEKKKLNFIRAFTDVEKKWDEKYTNKLWVEYLPNLTESEDYMINGEISFLGQLSSILSFKVGYLLKYRNQPVTATATRLDKLFTTGLIAKF